MSIDNKWGRALGRKLTGEMLIIEGYGGLKLVKSFGCLVRSVYLCTTETSRSRAVVAHRAHNPKVVGSSPASATIKNSRFHQKTAVFSNFLVVTKVTGPTTWGLFGVYASGNQSNIICNHGRGCGMLECVRMDMRKSIVPAEVIQPSGNAVRMKPFPVIFGEYHSGFFPVRPLLEAQPHLPPLPLF